MPAWLNPGKFNSLNRLYIRGGKLCNLSFEKDNKWNVRILRLKYLNLKVDEEQLRAAFPRLIYLEIKNKADDEIIEDNGENEHIGSSQQSESSL